MPISQKTKDNFSIWGTILAVAIGLVTLSVPQPLFKYIGWGIAAVIFIVSLPATYKAVKKSLLTVLHKRMVRNAIEFLGPGPIIQFTADAMGKREEYKNSALTTGIRYLDPMGKKVEYFKEQQIVALLPNVTTIWDDGLSADGTFIWNTFSSTPGSVRIDQKQSKGGLISVPTIFTEPLSVNKPFHRFMTVQMADAFLKSKQQENLVTGVLRTTDSLRIEITLHHDQTFKHWKPERYLLGRLMPCESDPELDGKNKLVWNIQTPCLGERYIILWTVN